MARRRTLITYGDVAPAVGIRINLATVGRLGHLLDELGRHERCQGRLLLPVLVVHKAEQTRGQGFYALARELRLLGGADADQEFFEQEW